MSRCLSLCAVLSLLLAACSAGAPSDDAACAAQSQGGMRWGYFPGYGCGPVPPALTKFP